MKLRYEKYDLNLKHPFTISRGSRVTSPSVIVELEAGGITGYGEAAPSSRYGESADTVEAFLRSAEVEICETELEIDRMMARLEEKSPGNMSAKAAIDIALHDWLGKRASTPVWKIWGLERSGGPLSSFTIGIDGAEMIGRKIGEAAGFPILKIKLGSGEDRAILEKIRMATDKPLRVDANEGWKTREIALEHIGWLRSMNVELIEQPLPAPMLADMRWLKERSEVPLIADESFSGRSDLDGLAGAFDGINVKLMKCGGLSAARKLIAGARARGLKVMIGCMIETSVGISAASQLLPLADYADLDGNILISNDPFIGANCDGGKILPPDEPGIGARKRI